MSKAFFPTYEEKFTKTPNVFFDTILPAADLNEIRLIGFLMRNTLGYNMDAPWRAVKREDLIAKAGCSNGSITNTIKKCIEKGWILVHSERVKGRQQKFFFLNDSTNEKIVAGLQAGYFTTSALQFLNKAGIENLLNQYDIQVPDTSPMNVEEEQKPSTTDVDEGLKTYTADVDEPSTTDVEDLYNRCRGESAASPDGTRPPETPKDNLFKDNLFKDKNNNKDIVVEEDDDSDFEKEKQLIKEFVGDAVSELTITSWLKHGTKEEIMKAWFEVKALQNVGDPGAYVMWHLKSGSQIQKNRNVREPNEQHTLFYEMLLGAAKEAAPANEQHQTSGGSVITAEFEDNTFEEAPDKGTIDMWNQALEKLEMEIPKAQFQTWVVPIRVLRLKNDQLVLGLKDEFSRDWVDSRYSVLIKNTISRIMKKDVKVRLVISSQSQSA